MKVLITGGCGFVGTNLAAESMKRGYKLAVLDNLFREGSAKNKAWLETQGEFKFYHADIRNQNDVEKSFKDFLPDVVFHLAGQVAMTTSIDNPRLDFEINALGTLNILECIRKFKPDTGILYSSSNKVYGDMVDVKTIEEKTRYVYPDYPKGLSESFPLHFESPYGCSKGSADQYLQDYARLYGIKSVVFRHSSIYGGRQFSTVDQGWIGWFCHKAWEIKQKTGKGTIQISGNGKQVRDVLHSQDAVELYFSTAAQIEKVKGRVFNIGGGVENSLSLVELFTMLESKLKIKIDISAGPWRQSDQKVFIADITGIHDAINWIPKIGKEKGVDLMLDWIKEIN